ncbi:DUF6653 family protein [Paenibacillus sp. NPDC056579]|uniref:DUF6653 family protein n=1 Tax=Paenibacillus sp. NPDC056579 TaxID=3345871 RepID=UPI0036B59EDD
MVLYCKRHSDDWPTSTIRHFKCVLGERVWLNRDKVPVPACHTDGTHLLRGVTAASTPLVIHDVIRLDLWMTAVSAAFVCSV